jgi:hypothetical protein
MKFDPSLYIVVHSVLSLKLGVTLPHEYVSVSLKEADMCTFLFVT